MMKNITFRADADLIDRARQIARDRQTSLNAIFRQWLEEYIVVVGIGLHISRLSSFRNQLDQDINHGYGLLERIEENTMLAAGGHVLGFEPLGYEGTHFHSWLCNDVPDDAHNRFGIRPNDQGFINEFEDAVRVVEYMKETGAEPAIWEPWLVVQYPNDPLSVS